MKSDFVYLDFNATTPVDADVLEAMLPWHHEAFGNASSRHQAGKLAANAVATAREQVADLFAVSPGEILFTTGATRSIELALNTVWAERAQRGTHFITVETEHKAVLDHHARIEALGATVTRLSVPEDGIIDLEELQEALRPDTAMVSIMWANNETGVIQPIEVIGKLLEKRNTLFMCDATQAVGKLEVKPRIAHIDLMPFSAHKFYGPKGVGGLYLNREARLDLWHNRAAVESAQGTANVPGIVGMGQACALIDMRLFSDQLSYSRMRDRLQTRLTNEYNATINGHFQSRLPNTANISIPQVAATMLLEALENHMAASTGSACSSGKPSHVLKAMGLSDDRIQGAIRFSVGRDTTTTDIDGVMHAIGRAVNALTH